VVRRNHARFLRRYGNLMVIIFRCETPLGAIASLACGPVGIGPACLYKTRKFGVMGASTVGVALAGVGSFLAAVVAGVFIFVGGRDHESRVSERARRFLTWLRDEF
jgi:hypothetical protein